jgi:hypothetical protein
MDDLHGSDPETMGGEVEETSLRLEGPEFERELREWEMTGRKYLAVPILLVGGVLVFLLGVLDITDLGADLAMRSVAIRAGLAVMSFVAAWRVWEAKQPRLLDAWIFGWSLMVVGALAARHLSAVDMPAMHHTLDIALTFLWLLLPNPLKLQMIPALIITTSALATDWGDGHPATLLGAYAFALIGGAAVAWERARTSRERFKAAKEIRTLRGLLPMCASCKQIRDDGGRWHPVERYLRERTELEFTHGMCPHCLLEYYGSHAVVEP